MTSVDHLDRLPGMGPAFARALIPSRRRGGALPAQTVVVDGYQQDPDRLAAYARVCAFTLRTDVPPTWLHVLTFPLHVHLLSDPESAVRLVGAVHVSNAMTLHRPVSLTDQLSLSVRAGNLRAHKRGALVDLIGAIDVDGERVWDGVSTYLARGVDAPGDAHESRPPAYAPRDPHGRWHLPADLGRRYRAVSHDPNPIHTSRIAARAFGFQRPIIHGMWTHARALAALDGRLPEAYSTSVEFARPLMLPATVGFSAVPTDVGHDVAVTDRDGNKPFLVMSVST